MQNSRKWFDSNPGSSPHGALVKNKEAYRELYRKSIEDPDHFWAEQARRYLTWDREWDSVLQYDFDVPSVEWFAGAYLNASYNCLDRHLDRLKNKVAFFWEGDDPGASQPVTYLDLFRRVNKFAALLQARGVEKGDRVVLYLPAIVELPVAMLACARIGAVHTVVFGGFGPDALALRIQESGAKVVVTADAGHRGGKTIPLRKRMEEALPYCPHVQTVILCRREADETARLSSKEIWWHEAEADPALPGYVKPVSMGAEDPLFILYTSGSNGKPLGVVHTHAGYLLYVAMTARLVFGLTGEETLWSTLDPASISGHSYSVYGPLLNGVSSVLFEGTPVYPDYDRYWSIVAKHRVDTLYTSPTVIRLLATAGAEPVTRHDISSLKVLGTVGQPIDNAAWEWYHRHVGAGRCPIVDTWWQTETGGHMIAPIPGVGGVKPGSCSFPFMGVEPVLLDPNTGEETKFPNQEGALFIRRPWPGMARTIFNDHERYREIYFSRFPGMYFTGDAARMDEEGYFWITGRIDEVINVSGYRIGPSEIEYALILDPRVVESAVVGCPHPIKGQAIYAFVTLASPEAQTEDLKAALKESVRTRIGGFAAPDAIQWTDALPKTRSGKVLRQLLQRIAARQFDSLGDVTLVLDRSVLEKLICDRMNIHL